MPRVQFHARFNKVYLKFIKHDRKRIQSIDKAIELFTQNPHHPSLNTEKLAGSEVWTIRLDRDNRMFFTWSVKKDTAIFFFVGAHDSYREL